MPAVRLVATDLDGTLLRDDGSISPRVVAALGRVQAAGIVVVLVTARNWRSVGLLASTAGVSHDGGLAICSNGAVVYDLARQVVRRARPADVAVVRSFVERCRAEVADACFAWETARGAYRTPAYHAIAVDHGFHRVYLDAIEIVDELDDGHEVTKLLVRSASLPADELLERLLPLAGELSLTVSGGPFVEVMSAGVTKALALAELCDELGVTASAVVAVGDQPNDLPMLTWAGRGVCMANAHPAVLAAPGLERTASNADDGLALVLEGISAGR